MVGKTLETEKSKYDMMGSRTFQLQGFPKPYLRHKLFASLNKLLLV